MLNLSLTEIDNNATKKTCFSCGVELTHKNQIKYCSLECMRAFHKKNKEKKYRRTCISCGKVFIMKHHLSGKHKKSVIKEGQFCSRKCCGEWRTKHKKKFYPSVKVYFPVCDVCGKVFIARTKRHKTCSKKCHNIKSLNKYYTNREDICRAARKKYVKKNGEVKPFKCRWCGKTHYPKYGERRKVYCSIECARAANRGSAFSSFSLSPKDKAKINGVYYEKVNPFEVFKRDGWRCQLCGKKLKKKNRGTIRDDAPELDHIITWADGGEHSYKNTQCSCRKCNREKNSRSKGQLFLFGM